jgi:hypothetical protein
MLWQNELPHEEQTLPSHAGAPQESQLPHAQQPITESSLKQLTAWNGRAFSSGCCATAGMASIQEINKVKAAKQTRTILLV